jgi:hypothetical protein
VKGRGVRVVNVERVVVDISREKVREGLEGTSPEDGALGLDISKAAEELVRIGAERACSVEQEGRGEGRAANGLAKEPYPIDKFRVS